MRRFNYMLIVLMSLSAAVAVLVSVTGVRAEEGGGVVEYVEAMNSGDRAVLLQYVTEHYAPAMFQRLPAVVMVTVHMAGFYMTGMSYFDYVREQIYKPAGMINTDAWDKDRPVPNRATGYMKEPAETGVRWQTNMVTRVMKGSPSGGSYSTAPDLLRFDHALRGHKLLSPEYTEIVLSGKPEINAPNVGYGFYVAEGDIGRIAQHSGDGTGINAEFTMYLDAGYTTIVLSNYNRPAADMVEQVIHQMLIAR